jgi:hypothetical protein
MSAAPLTAAPAQRVQRRLADVRWEAQPPESRAAPLLAVLEPEAALAAAPRTAAAARTRVRQKVGEQIGCVGVCSDVSSFVALQGRAVVRVNVNVCALVCTAGGGGAQRC